MSISRIIRVLITIVLVISFFLIIFSSYERNKRTSKMIELSDATSSISARLTTRDLAYRGPDGNLFPYTIDRSLIENIDFNGNLGGDNFRFNVDLETRDKSSSLEEYGPKAPKDRMTCALSMPIGLHESGSINPGLLRVVAWYS